MQTCLVVDELRRRGHPCHVLNINENRQRKSPHYIDVQNGLDYLLKLVRYSVRGFRLNPHLNGKSKKGYLLALTAALIGRLNFRPAILTFHGGLGQEYFPRYDATKPFHAFRLLFHLCGSIACDSPQVMQAIEGYGIHARKITPVPTFSLQYVQFRPQPLPRPTEEFLSKHHPVFLAYLCFRPEYRVELLRAAMNRFRSTSPNAGFVWVGFPDSELPQVHAWVGTWPASERAALLLLGNLPHDAYLTLLKRCTAYLRTPETDGVAASVLEAQALGLPVIASENGSRPLGVLNYHGADPKDMCVKMQAAAVSAARSSSNEAYPQDFPDNIALMADWLAQSMAHPNREPASSLRWPLLPRRPRWLSRAPRH
jgi:glycosyltransferase involved in cell wall biosynthesis